MSETAKLDAAPALNALKKSNDLKPEEQTKKNSNDLKSDKVADKMNNEAVTGTPASKGRKRVSEASDTTLVLETPPGTDGSRRQTRSQTRGTPAPTPAKKEKLNNSSSAKGRRGRPPKSGSTEEKSGEEDLKSEDEEVDVKTPKQKNGDKVDGVVLSKKPEESKPAAPVEKVEPVVKSVEAKPEKPISQEKPKVVEKVAVTKPEPAVVSNDTKVVSNNSTPVEVLNNSFNH